MKPGVGCQVSGVRSTRAKNLPLGSRWLNVLVVWAAMSCAPSEDAGSRQTTLLDSTTVTLEQDQVAIEYIAHAAFRIHSAGGNTVLIDPYASRVWLGYDFPDGVGTDAILITHPHYDHDAGDFRGMPFPWDSTIPVFREPGTATVGDITIHGVEGKHADPYGMEFGQINTIWVVEIAGIRIAHVGDNGALADANVAALGRVDILMMPIDGVYHILKEEEIQAARDALRPRVLIPMHYRLPDLEASPDSPSDLGEIDPWLAGKNNVTRVGGHVQIFERVGLPDTEQIVVFDHSPAVKPPSN